MFNFGNIVLTNFIPILAVVLITIIRIVEARRKKIAQQKDAELKREIMVSQTQEEEEDRVPPWIKELQTQEEKPEEEISIISIAKIEHIEQKSLLSVHESPPKIEEKKNTFSSKIARYSPLKQGLIWSEVLRKPKGLN